MRKKQEKYGFQGQLKLREWNSIDSVLVLWCYSIEYMDQVFENAQNKGKSSPLLTPANSHHALKLLQQTASLSRFNALRPTSHEPKGQNLPSIALQMQKSKKDLHSTMYNNHSKLNTTFSGYLRSELTMARDELRKKKIRKFKKVEEKGADHVETQPLQRQEAYIEGSFRMAPLLNRCFDSLFPSLRYSPTLFAHDRSLYLLGGYQQHGSEGLTLFHSYEFENRKWVQVRSQGDAPRVCPCFHTVEIYRGHMVVVGGVTLEGEKGKRFNSELLVFNLEKGEWLRARGGISLKNHASTIFGSTIMVSGGINEKDRFSEQLYFITFSGGNVHSPLILGVRTHEQVEKLAHHQLVNTYELEGNLRSQVRLEGVFCFGGENEEGTVNNALSFINVLGKGGQNLDIKFKRWEPVSTNDDRPCPRKEHTLTLIAKKAVAVLAGGIDQPGRWLDDVWLLDLVRLSWTKVSTSPSIGESIGFLAGHCACAVGSVVYFYNGQVEKKREKALWMLETESPGYKTKKTIFSTKLPSFKSLLSNKELLSFSRL